MSLTGPIFLPRGKGLMVDGKFCTRAEGCCCGGGCDDVCYTACATCRIACAAQIGMTFTRTITGTPPPNLCTIACSRSATLSLDRDVSTNDYIYWTASGDHLDAFALLRCVDGVLDWTFAITDCYSKDPGCVICPGSFEHDTSTTTIVPFDGVSFSSGVIVTTVSYNYFCNMTVTEVYTLQVINNNPCPE